LKITLAIDQTYCYDYTNLVHLSEYLYELYDFYTSNTPQILTIQFGL